jgi:DNA polymerase (family 10)
MKQGKRNGGGKESVRNAEIAKIFHNMADLLEIKGDNPFKVRAYQKAAQNIESLTEELSEIARRGELEEIPGIGKDLAQKIMEMLQTRKLGAFEELGREIPEGLLELVAIPGLGPKKAKLLYDKMSIQNMEELEKAARADRLKDLPGFGAKTEENILAGIELVRRGRERMLLGRAFPLAQGIMAKLDAMPEVHQISEAGSLRRRRETVRDIDILITSSDPEKVMDAFASLLQVREVLAKGGTKASVLTSEGMQVDLRVVEPDTYGAALAYFTGSKAHNIRLREMANRMGLKISEYGVFRDRDQVRVAGRTEEEIYRILGLPYIPPELREDRGEIEAALEGRLPQLVDLGDIRGDLHCHSRWSDGAHSIREVAEGARKKGYSYMALTDHSQSLGIARGLSPELVEKQLQEIAQVNRELKGFTILPGTEVDILKDGSLDLPDEILSRLSVVVASVHSSFKQNREVITARIIKAMRNPYITILGHPTGRLLGEREAYDVDLEKVIKAARDTGTFLEVNAYPQRLDLDDIHCKRAKELGVTMAIGTDSHTISQLEQMPFGVAVARRGWLERKDLLNTLSPDDLHERLEAQRKAKKGKQK